MKNLTKTSVLPKVNKQNTKNKSKQDTHGDFFLYNSLADEREVCQLLDVQSKQHFDSYNTYED